MKLIFIHISDLHIKTKNDLLFNRLSAFLSAISSIYTSTPNIKAAFILCVGDIAFSGKSNEYTLANRYFSNLKKELQKSIDLGVKLEFLFLPGNHDCNFDYDNGTRQTIINSIPNIWDDSVIKSCLVTQTEYYRFSSKWQKNETPREKINKEVVFRVEDKTIEFQLLNTALFSKKQEEQGSLFFPTSILEEIGVSDKKPSSLSISLLHHPYNWFEANNGRMIKEVLEKKSDLVLTGHEHVLETYSKTKRNKGQISYLEGGVFQESGSDESAFNIVVIDLEKKLMKTHQLSWSKDNNRYEEIDTPDWETFIKNPQREKQELKLSENFKNYLDDPGANYTHSKKQTLKLDDIFTPPHIKFLQKPGEDEEKSVIREFAVQTLLEEKKVLLLGSEKSGKTTLAKVMVSKCKESGFAAVFINAEEIKRSEEVYIIDLINKKYTTQYDEPDETSYRQFQKEKRVIIIDDLHKSRLNLKNRGVAISVLEGYADKIFIFGEKSLIYKDVVSENEGDLFLWKYTTCEILAFGYQKRNQIIKKWFSIDEDVTTNEIELTKRVRGAEKIVTQLIGKNLAPSYPLFILILLQQIEAQTPLNITSTSGSHGFLYELLLTKALTQASKLSPDLETQYNYLSEMANNFFVLQVKGTTQKEFEDWHQRYCFNYKSKLIGKEILQNFIDAGVLSNYDNEISFRYPYLYYYFLGRYFRDHIQEEKIRGNIKSMSKSLYNEESANVLIFLSYLTKDSIIISSILETAKELFSSYSECDLVVDTQFLNKIIAEIPKLSLDRRSPDARHREVLISKDKYEMENKKDSEDEFQDSEGLRDKEDEFFDINVATKTIQILGQILRNYSGSLPGDQKLELATNTYKLGLRMLKFMFETIDETRQDLIDKMIGLIRKEHPKWVDERLEKYIGSMVFGITEGLSVLVIKQITDAIGHESLSIVFDEIENSGGNVSNKFININIGMYHYNSFPKNEVLSLYKMIRKNAFASQLTRHLVWSYLYVYPLPYNDVVAICKKLDIQLSQNALLDKRLKLLEG